MTFRNCSQMVGAAKPDVVFGLMLQPPVAAPPGPVLQPHQLLFAVTVKPPPGSNTPLPAALAVLPTMRLKVMVALLV